MSELLRYFPDDLLQKFREERKQVPIAEFFSKPKHKKLQEIWCAAHFGRGLQLSNLPCHILIGERDLQTDVDFEVEAATRLHEFQLVEAQAPDRRRGDEYKGKSQIPWTDGTLHGAEWVRLAIEKKAKHYGTTCNLHLLVYLNFIARDLQYEDVYRHTTSVASKFQSVWLMNGNALCCIHHFPTLPFPRGWLLIEESR